MKYRKIPLKMLLRDLIISVCFVLTDTVAVFSLWRLGISYGTGMSLYTIITVFIFFRGVILCLWWFVQLMKIICMPGAVWHSRVWWLIVINLIFLLVLLYGTYIEPMRLTVSRIQVHVPGLSQLVRIVQISDIHVEFTTRREEALPGLVNSFNPDMIVITGDFTNESYTGKESTMYDLRDLIQQLHAPLGIYGVNGNAETPWILHKQLEGQGVRLLNDQIVRLPQLGSQFAILGVQYMNNGRDEKALKELMAKVDTDDFILLLYHKPDLAYTAKELGVDLYLAGHTHGGQVRLPIYGAIFPNSRYGKKFEMGLYHLDNTTLFVSRGLGMTGGTAPRVRFLAPPEVVVIDLLPDDSSSGQ